MDLLILGAFFLAVVFVVLALLPPMRSSMVYLFGAAFVCLLIAVGLYFFGHARNAGAAPLPLTAAQTALAAPGIPTYSGPGLANMDKPGAWNCDQEGRWVAGPRWGAGSANGATLGTAFPDNPGDTIDYAMTVEPLTQARYFNVTLVSKWGDIVIEYPFSFIVPEPGYSYPTGRFDPLGSATPFYNGGLAKFTIGLWGGGSPADDRGGRVYLNCTINPLTSP